MFKNRTSLSPNTSRDVGFKLLYMDYIRSYSLFAKTISEIVNLL